MPSAPPPPGPVGSIEPDRFKTLLQNPDVAHEFFLPPERASWLGDRYTLGSVRAADIRSQIAGVRVNEPDASNLDKSLEEGCQEDFARLVSSVRRLREAKELSGVVISDEVLLSNQAGAVRGKRARFGLRLPADDRFSSDEAAARECHKQMERAIRRAGYRVVQPGRFDPCSGLVGLESWARSLRLRKRNVLASPWLLLLGLPLLLLIPWRCSGQQQVATTGATTTAPAPAFFGMPIETKSYIILLDKSGSMGPHFAQVKSEAERLLQEMKLRGSFGKVNADLIAYDHDSYSALGGLQPLTDDTVNKIVRYLGGLSAGGGTALERAIDRAAGEIRAHGEDTTLIILTDGDDSSIRKMLSDVPGLRSRFKGINIFAHTATPRAFNPTADSTPINDYERAMRDFSQALGGQFGGGKGGTK